MTSALFIAVSAGRTVVFTRAWNENEAPEEVGRTSSERPFPPPLLVKRVFSFPEKAHGTRLPVT